MPEDQLAARRRRSDLKKVAAARKHAADAGRYLRSAIIIAVESGASHAEVADRAGLSRSRITQIIREESGGDA